MNTLEQRNDYQSNITWRIKISSEEREPSYANGFCLDGNKIISSTYYFNGSNKPTFKGRRLSENGFTHNLKLISYRPKFGLVILEAENGSSRGVSGVLADDWLLGYGEAIYGTFCFEGLTKLFHEGNVAFPCSEVVGFETHEGDALCESYMPDNFENLPKVQGGRKLGDIFNMSKLQLFEEKNCDFPRKAAALLPIIQCNMFPITDDIVGCPVFNYDRKIVGMVCAVFGHYCFAIHVRAIQEFIRLHDKSKREEVSIKGKSASGPSKKRKLSKEAPGMEEDKSKKQKTVKSHIHSSLMQSLNLWKACTTGPISKEQAKNLVLPVAKFIIECDAAHIRLAPEIFISVCERFQNYVELLEAPRRGVAPLLTAVKKLQSSPEHLSTLHADFLQLCLLTKCYKTGFCILEDSIFEVDQPKDLYLYCYYGGMICIGLKRCPKALELLHNVVTAPMSSLSVIAVEAYKKYILVSLIHLGQFSTSFPKYTAKAQRALKNCSQLYIQLVSCYGNGKASELEVFIQANDDKFESARTLSTVKDHKLGLAKQVLSSTYLTLSLEDIANTVEQAYSFVLPVAKFILECDAAQIRLASEKFISVCKRFHNYVELLEAPMQGVTPLLAAVKKLQSSPEHLATLHPDFLQLCLLTKCYKTGFRILEDDKFKVDQPKGLYRYCYYGGMICIGLKRYPKALELQHNVLSASMSSLSAIAVEAYKKYILVLLIHLGQFSISFPKYTAATAQRGLKNFSQLYIEPVSCYGSGKVSKLEVFIQTNKGKFESDHNLGLAKQVLSSMYKQNIQRPIQTYLTFSIEDIAKAVELSSSREAEMHVLQMIQDGEIYAAINQKDGMAIFLEDSEQYKTCEMIEWIDFSIERMTRLSKKLNTVDRLISCDSQYLGKERQIFDFDDFDSVPQTFNI